MKLIILSSVSKFAIQNEAVLIRNCVVQETPPNGKASKPAIAFNTNPERHLHCPQCSLERTAAFTDQEGLDDHMRTFHGEEEDQHVFLRNGKLAMHNTGRLSYDMQQEGTSSLSSSEAEDGNIEQSGEDFATDSETQRTVDQKNKSNGFLEQPRGNYHPPCAA